MDKNDVAGVTQTLAATAQRTRLLVNGVAGPLSDRQRELGKDILSSLDLLLAAFSETPTDVKLTDFHVGNLVADACSRLRFVAKARLIEIKKSGTEGYALARADHRIADDLVFNGLASAIKECKPGSAVSIMIARTVERISVDILAAGWEPRLPAPVPGESRVGFSVLRTSNGARLVIVLDAAEA